MARKGAVQLLGPDGVRHGEQRPALRPQKSPETSDSLPAIRKPDPGLDHVSFLRDRVRRSGSN